MINKAVYHAGTFIVVLTLLMVTKKHQKWSWVLADFEVSLLQCYVDHHLVDAGAVCGVPTVSWCNYVSSSVIG